MTAAPSTVTPKLAAIRAYQSAGFALIPLCSHVTPHEHQGKACSQKNMGKVPPRFDWQKTTVDAYTDVRLNEGNWGVVIPETIVVVDVDPRNFKPGDSPLARLSKLCGGLSSYTVNTGGGGLHIYFRVPAGLSFVNQLKEYPGIEFKSRGKQVVGPGSIHAISGKEYVAASGNVQELAELPAALLVLISKKEEAADDGLAELTNGPAAYDDSDSAKIRYREYLEKLAPLSVEGQGGDLNAFAVAARGRDIGLSPAVTLDLLLAHWNERCSPPWGLDELKGKVRNSYSYAKGRVGADSPAADFSVVDEIKKELPKPVEEELRWQHDANGIPRKTFLNLLNYLRAKDGGLYKIFGYNELSSRVEFVSPAPWHKGKLPRWPVFGGTDIKMLKGYLSTRHKFEVSVQAIEEAVTYVAYHERFHPVKEYLNGLVWDGEKRLDAWLSSYLGVEDSPYSRAVGRKVLCAAVMRAFSPGIKFDHVLVLEGRQDLGKSTVVEILGGPYASDAPVDPHSRDTVDSMQGRWIIEIAEMEVLRKTDEDALKAFITRRTDRCRLAYGLTTVDFPRQSIFIATKNPRADGAYLKDDTGNRRWWPVACGSQQVDFKGLRDARDQIFAEAVNVCRTAPGEKLYMDTLELKEEAARVVDARHAEHEWTEAVARWISETDRKPETRRAYLTTRDVFLDGMNGQDVRFDKRAQNALAGILRNLGWVYAFRRIDKRFVRVWIRRADSAIDNLVDEL